MAHMQFYLINDIRATTEVWLKSRSPINVQRRVRDKFLQVYLINWGNSSLLKEFQRYTAFLNVKIWRGGAGAGGEPKAGPSL